MNRVVFRERGHYPEMEVIGRGFTEALKQSIPQKEKVQKYLLGDEKHD